MASNHTKYLKLNKVYYLVLVMHHIIINHLLRKLYTLMKRKCLQFFLLIVYEMLLTGQMIGEICVMTCQFSFLRPGENFFFAIDINVYAQGH